MLFPCTPYEVVQFTVEKLSFSGKYGLTIDELWLFIKTSFNQADNLDDFQKQTIWQWLFFENDDEETHESKLYVTYKNNPIPINLNYNTFIAKYTDRENVRVLPQYEVQAFYLTGVSNNKMFFKALGEKPYELLQEIAKHGANGIWSPDLVEATGQDNRSLTSRLKKLEDNNLIIKEGRFYAKRKTHSNLIIHMKFAGSVADTIDDGSREENKPKKKKPTPKKISGDGDQDEGDGAEGGDGNNDDNGDDDDDGGAAFYWRSRNRVRTHMIEAVKNAPHQIRVYRDLKRELRMDQSKAKSVFFTAITRELHNAGILEKVNIRDKETDKFIYALKFVKDALPEFIGSDEFAFNGMNGFNGDKDQDQDQDGDDDQHIENIEGRNNFPMFNNLFPLPVLAAQAIHESRDGGTTIKDIIKLLYSDSRHRMLERLFDILPSYQLKGDTLEHLIDYPDEDETSGIMRTYESEGKIKFYKFYIRENYQQELKLKSAKKKRPITKVFTDGDLNKVEKALSGKVNDRAKGPLFEKPKRLGSANILLHPEMGETLPEIEEEPVPTPTPIPTATAKSNPKAKKSRLSSLNKLQSEPVPKKAKKRKLTEEANDLDSVKGNDIVSRIKRAARKRPIIIEELSDEEEIEVDVDDEEYKEPVVAVPDQDVNMKENNDDDDDDEKEEEKEEDNDESIVVNPEIEDSVVSISKQYDNKTPVKVAEVRADIFYDADSSFNSDISFNDENGETRIFIPRKTKERSVRRRNIGFRERRFVDNKAELRRNLILEITKSRGGVAYTSSEFTRELDVKLGNMSTKIDRKTLTRDLSRLRESGDIEVEKVEMQLSGQDVTRWLFMITEEGFRPSQEQIDSAREECRSGSTVPASRQSRRHRTVESEYALFAIDSPFIGRRLDSLTTVKRGSGKTGGRRSLLKDVPFDGDDIVSQQEEVMVDMKPKKRSRNKSNKNTNGKTRTTTVLEVDDEDDDEVEGEVSIEIKQEPKKEMSSIVRKKLKRKTAPEKRTGKGRSKDDNKAVAFKMDEEGEITLFRAICISKAFIRNMIDFESISEMFDGADVDSLRKSWSLLRRSVGGVEVINRGVKEFERIVTRAIEEEDIEASDLENIRYPFFLELWSRYETEYEQIMDVMPLYKHMKDNENHYKRVLVNVFTNEIYDVYETPSMTTKEVQLANTPFFEDSQDDDDEEKIDSDLLKVSPHVEYDDIRTVFKAVFGTSKQNGASDQLDKLLMDYSTEVLRKVSEGMIKDRELLYFGDDNENNFMLTEKVYGVLQVRIKSIFLNQAARFKENLIPLVNSNKGFILSQGISNGQMAQVLQFVSDSLVSLGRIDKNYDFEGYESRLLNKGFLDCEIVIYKPDNYPLLEEDIKMTSSIPTGKICSRLWLDVNGQIDSKLWRDILIAMLYHFHFRPGVTLDLIFNKFDSLLSARDFNSVIGWLLENEFLTKNKYGGFYTTGNWLTVLGN